MNFPFNLQPPYNNPPIEPQNFNPSQFFISNIVLGQTTTVTTTTNMNYVIGQEVRLLIPPQNGSVQLNEKKGYVVSLPASNQVVVLIDSSQNVDSFVTSTSIQQPQIVPVGDINSGKINSTGRINTGTYVPGSFINVSA